MSGVKSPSSLQALTSFGCHMKQSLPNVWVGASSKEMRIKATPTVLGKNLNELYSVGGNGPTYYLLLILCESFLFETKVYTCIHWYSCFCVARFILWFIVFVSFSNPPLLWTLKMIFKQLSALISSAGSIWHSLQLKESCYFWVQRLDFIHTSISLKGKIIIMEPFKYY